MTKEEIIRVAFHGFSDDQWGKLKNSFPYCEIPFIAQRYADQQTAALREQLEDQAKIIKELKNRV